MDRALAICMEQKPKSWCRQLADLWLERNLTAEFSASTTFCDMLRPLMTEAGLEEDELAGSRRRGHRRRNYQRRRRDRRRSDRRRRQITCGEKQVRLTNYNTCCDISVEGSWGLALSIAGTSFKEITWGYTTSVTDFEMQSTYEATTTSAGVGFEAYGASGSTSVVNETSEGVVRSTEITRTIQANGTHSDTWYRSDGTHLWQWKWTTIFHGPKECTDEPDATVATLFTVQSDELPECLPAMSRDKAYQRCKKDGKMS